MDRDAPYLFAAIGGCGSNYLIRALATRYEVAVKPDAAFRPRCEHLTAYERGIDQGSFETRSNGYRVPDGASLADILPAYVAYLRAEPQRTAVFNTAPELGLFSRLRIADVVFLVRHPVHAYVSWAKPDRHGDIIADLGGIEAPASLEYYSARWNAVVRELATLRNLGLLGGRIRYEFAARDSVALGLQWIFEDFTPRWNCGVLSLGAEEHVRRCTQALYSRLYSDWRI